MIMSAKALLNENPSPTEEEVKEALSGNFCRCISHYHVVKAVMVRFQQREVRTMADNYRYIGKGHPPAGRRGDCHRKDHNISMISNFPTCFMAKCCEAPTPMP